MARPQPHVLKLRPRDPILAERTLWPLDPPGDLGTPEDIVQLLESLAIYAMHPTILTSLTSDSRYLSFNHLQSLVNEHTDPFGSCLSRLNIDDFRCVHTLHKDAVLAMPQDAWLRGASKGLRPVSMEQAREHFKPTRRDVVVKPEDEGYVPMGPEGYRFRLGKPFTRTVGRICVEQADYPDWPGFTRADLLLLRGSRRWLNLYFRAQLDDVYASGLHWFAAHPDEISLPFHRSEFDPGRALWSQCGVLQRIVAVQDRRASEDFAFAAKRDQRSFKITALEIYLDSATSDPVASFAKIRAAFEQVFPWCIEIEECKEVEGPGLQCPLGSNVLVKLYLKDGRLRFEVVFFERHPLPILLSERGRDLSAAEVEAAVTTATRPYLRAFWKAVQRSVRPAPMVGALFEERAAEALSRCRTEDTRERMRRFLDRLLAGDLIPGNELRSPLGKGRRQMEALMDVGLVEGVYGGEDGAECVSRRIVITDFVSS